MWYNENTFREKVSKLLTGSLQYICVYVYIVK